MATKIKELRERLKKVKADGRAKETRIDELRAKDNPSDAETSELSELTAAVAGLVDEAEELAAEYDAAVEADRRSRAFAELPANDQPGRVVVLDNTPDPAETFGFDDLGQFALAVKLATPGGPRFSIDERLQQYAAPTSPHVAGGSDEGIVVPPAFRDRIWEAVFSERDLISMCDVEPTESNQVGMGADESTPWGATGVQARWRSETAQMTESKLDTDERQTRLHELYAFVTAGDDLLSDAPRLNARLNNKAPMAIRWKASDAVMNGSGAGQPLGILKAGALVTQTKEGGQAANTVNADNVAKMFSRMLPGSIPNAVWLINSEVIPKLLTMTLGDNAVYALPREGFTSAPGGFLFGRPVIPTEHCQALSALGDIVFADLKGYYVADKRSGMQFASSIHLYFDYKMTAFRWTFKLGGQPYLSTPQTPARGSATKSHFVALEAR